MLTRLTTVSASCLLWFAVFVNAKTCENGIDNVISLRDLSGDSGWIRFHDVKLATFDANLRPFCVDGLPALHFPGFLQFVSGIVEVRQSMDARIQRISLDLSAEQNSFFIGEVCKHGRSQSTFVVDDLWHSWDLCALLGEDSCKFFEKVGRMQIAEVYPDFLPLEPVTVRQVEGEWSLSATLKYGNDDLARIALPRKWYQVVLGENHDEILFRQIIEQKKHNRGEAQKANDEL